MGQAGFLPWQGISPLLTAMSTVRDKDMSSTWRVSKATAMESDSSMHMCALLVSHVQLFATPCTVACQAPLSIGFSRQEYWSGLPCPPPGDLPDPGIESELLISPAL